MSRFATYLALAVDKAPGPGPRSELADQLGDARPRHHRRCHCRLSRPAAACGSRPRPRSVLRAIDRRASRCPRRRTYGDIDRSETPLSIRDAVSVRNVVGLKRRRGPYQSCQGRTCPDNAVIATISHRPLVGGRRRAATGTATATGPSCFLRIRRFATRVSRSPSSWECRVVIDQSHPRSREILPG